MKKYSKFWHFTSRLLPALLIMFILMLGLWQTRQTAAQTDSLPASPPNAERGLEIYAARCANCHGPTGGGDGELATNLPNPPIAFSEPGYRNTAVPALLFETITNGRIDKGMPPFGPASSNPLSDTDRWDLVAAIFSLATPPEVIATGETIYQNSCADCHGTTGLGDGPEATNQPAPPTNLADFSYWLSRNNELVISKLDAAEIPAHSFTLTEDEQQAVVDYARTLSYNYRDPLAPVEPITDGIISGQVVNGTTGTPITEGVVLLRAFTIELQPSLALTTTLTTNGRFQFELPPVPPDLVYLTSFIYNDISFSSQVGQISRNMPELSLPITVYETTTDPQTIQIDQMHLVLDFIEDRVRVSELYAFTNDGTAVFVGETGNPNNGTVNILLPANATNVTFQRSLGSLNSFLPANEVIQTEIGWADVIPVRPNSTLNLLVQYELPYRDGLTIAHPVQYPVSTATAVMLDVGVRIAEGEWISQGVRETESGIFLNYARGGLVAGDSLRLQLNGRPRIVFDASGNALAARNENTELFIGAGTLLLTLGVVGYLVQNWRKTAVVTHQQDIQHLLEEIARLDDAYESGALHEDDYTQQRRRLLDQVINLWPHEQKQVD
ncbi:MAG: hypothetical protein D6706_11485 [Chloroflexi bacterium]|nr:MAG: hypothetical protein D6706_11485 [Chloroflexota bacterium]